MYILGINAYHGDASAALTCDGVLVAAAEEERFNRIKHCAGFPARAIQYCLQAAGITAADLEHIGISRDPSAHLHKKILFSMTRLSKMHGIIADRLANAAKVRDLREEFARAVGISKSDIRAEFHSVEHHKAHMASCFLVSEFDDAAILSIDGFGDFISTMWGYGKGHNFEVLGEIEYPHSVGILYTATSQYIGFPKYGDEGKVMGLAPYGKPVYLDQFREIVRADGRGRFTLNLDYFLHHSEGVEMTWDEGSPKIGRIYSDAFRDVFGPERKAGEPLAHRHEDVAASLQARLEEVAFDILNGLYEHTQVPRLCIAGGVAFNSVMNGKIPLRTPFRQVYIQPAAGDGGTSVGVCYYIWNSKLGRPRTFRMDSTYTGPDYSNAEMEETLRRKGIAYRQLDDDELIRSAAQAIGDGKIVGWFQGQMEFGPRALGNRSIIADPRRAEMKDILNARIKKREPFRPFAPSILEERQSEYFEHDHPSPHMLMVHQIREDKRAIIPAVTHVDGSGRLQSVSRKTNWRYHQLISDFGELTGVPVVLNTSFNEDEPIVCNPEDAVNCFQKTRMDVLFLGNYLVAR